jgi:hypothetical protein
MVLGIVIGAAPASAIQISLNFNPSVPPAEEAVIREAAARWEDRIVSTEQFSVTVVMASLPAGRLGQASGYTSTGGIDVGTGLRLGTPAGGTISFDTSTAFFVDGTPMDDVEYVSNIPATPTFLDADTSNPANPAVGNYDLLSVAIHELGHVLGVSSAFDAFAAGVLASPNTSRWVYVFAATPALGDPLGDYNAGHFFVEGGVLLPSGEDDPEEAGSMSGKPSHLDAAISPPDPSAGIFPFDNLNPTLNVSERINVADVDLDILVDAYGYTVVPEPGADLMAVVALGTIAALRARRRDRSSRPH